MDADIVSTISLLSEKMDSFSTGQDAVLTKVSEIQSQLSQLNTASKNQGETLLSLKKENHELRREIARMKEAQDRQIQGVRNNEIQISGIPYARGENLLQLFDSMMRALNLEIPNVAVDSIYRLKSKFKIIVRLLRRIDKDLIVNTAKRCRLTGKDIGLNSCDDANVYINESLSPNIAKLFYEVRKFQKEFGVKFAWHRDGAVFLKRFETDSPLRINSLEDIEELRNHIQSMNQTIPSNSFPFHQHHDKAEDNEFNLPMEISSEKERNPPSQSTVLSTTTLQSDVQVEMQPLTPGTVGALPASQNKENENPQLNDVYSLPKSNPKSSPLFKSWAQTLTQSRSPRAVKLSDKLADKNNRRKTIRTSPY